MKNYLFFILILFSQVAIGQHISSDNGDSISTDEPEMVSIIKSYPTQITSIPNGSEKKYVYIDFVGSGDIQKSLSEGEEVKANTGMGVIFERYNGIHEIIQSFELEGVINIASTSDSIKSEFKNARFTNRRSFGDYVLNPISTNQSLYINSNLYFGYPKRKYESTNLNFQKDTLSKFAHFAKVISGINLRAIASNSVWKYDETPIHLGVIAARAGFFYEFIPDDYRLAEQEKRSKFSIFLGANYTFRGVIGDITSPKNDMIRYDILGSNKTKFHGIEFNFGFKLNNLRAEFQVPILDKGDDGSIDGLTNAQFLFSIKFVGGFSLKVNPVNINSDRDKSK